MSPEEEYYLELLRKLLEGSLTPEERDTLSAMTETDADKQDLLRYLTTEHQDKDPRLEAEIIYEKTLPNDLIPLPHANHPPGRTRKLFRSYWPVTAAACLIFLFSTVWLLNRRTTPMADPQQWEHIVTERGERKFFRLNDGTEIWLNSESSLKVKNGYGKAHRMIELQGEAYFSVAKNKTLPLYVKAYHTEIEVLGTVFNIRAYPEEQKIITSLVEGKVKLHVAGMDGRKDYTLNPGDKVEVINRQLKKNLAEHTGAALAEINTVDDLVDYKKINAEDNESSELMWVENKLVFNADPLQDMVKKMERWYNRTIIIQNDDLKDQLFTGTFQERTCEQVLDLLKKTCVQLNYTVENDTIYIK